MGKRKREERQEGGQEYGSLYSWVVCRSDRPASPQFVSGTASRPTLLLLTCSGWVSLPQSHTCPMLRSNTLVLVARLYCTCAPSPKLSYGLCGTSHEGILSPALQLTCFFLLHATMDLQQHRRLTRFYASQQADKRTSTPFM